MLIRPYLMLYDAFLMADCGSSTFAVQIPADIGCPTATCVDQLALHLWMPADDFNPNIMDLSATTFSIDRFPFKNGVILPNAFTICYMKQVQVRKPVCFVDWLLKIFKD